MTWTNRGSRRAKVRHLLKVALFASVCTSSSSMAAPLDSVPTGRWHQFPSSRMDAVQPSLLPPGYIQAAMVAWSGGVYDTDRERLVAWGGGHGDYGGNEVYAFGPLTSDTPRWERLTNPQYSKGFSTGGVDFYDFTINGKTGQPWSAGPTAPAGVRISGYVIGTFGRFRYVPSQQDVIVVNSTDESVYFFKLGGSTSTAPAPTINFAASPTSVASQGTSTLTWSTTNAASCSASGAWTGAKATSGSEARGPLSANSTFVLTCANSAPKGGHMLKRKCRHARGVPMKSRKGSAKSRKGSQEPNDSGARTWVALAIVAVALGIDIAVLAMLSEDRDLLGIVIARLHDLLNVVVGYYFGKQKSAKA